MSLLEHGGSMGSSPSALELQKEVLKISGRKRKNADIVQAAKDMAFFNEQVLMEEKDLKAIEENIIESREAENEHSKKHRLKGKLFWLFMEYFFESSNIPLKNFMGKIEKNIILRTLYRANGEQKKAAEILGLKYTTLNEKIKKYRIHIQR